jgi:hypothetical protein
MANLEYLIYKENIDFTYYLTFGSKINLSVMPAINLKKLFKVCICPILISLIVKVS